MLNSLPPSGALIARAEPINIPPQPPQQTGSKAAVATPPTPVAPPTHIIPGALQAPEATPGLDNQTPFGYGDFSWLNGSARTKDSVLDKKFFTPEVRFDTHYMTDFNQPIDHTIVGSTESFRSSEVQIEQISVGGGIKCLGRPSNNKSSFVGWMLYNRMWFHKYLLGLTLGGGNMSNFGRYLTLLPPINGADAVSGSPYFTENPGQRAHMWDSTVTLQYMPRQYITWWAEVGYRHADVPYFAGRGGVTPPGGNTGSPQYYTCSSGGTAGTAVLAAAEAACGGGLSSVWFPDLRRSEAKLSFGILVVLNA